MTEAKGKIKDLDTLKATFPAVGKECGGCHETFRVKNELIASLERLMRTFAWLKEKGGRLTRPPFVLLRYRRAKLRGRTYFVTWPRISPPGLAAVWMLM